MSGGREVSALCQVINQEAEKSRKNAEENKIRRKEALTAAKIVASVPGIPPSGPRQAGEGCEDADQSIISAGETASGGAVLHVTLLAAGFVIGPSGASIRALSATCESVISSWNENFEDSNGIRRRVRTIIIEGSKDSVVASLEIIKAAVDRYKDLCEGKYCGQYVDRIQEIMGVKFFYSPPPRSAVPYAAALKCDFRASRPLQSREFHQDKENFDSTSSRSHQRIRKNDPFTTVFRESWSKDSCLKHEEDHPGHEKEAGQLEEISVLGADCKKPAHNFRDDSLGIVEVVPLSDMDTFEAQNRANGRLNTCAGHPHGNYPSHHYQLFGPANQPVFVGFPVPETTFLQTVNANTVNAFYSSSVSSEDMYEKKAKKASPSYKQKLVEKDMIGGKESPHETQQIFQPNTGALFADFQNILSLDDQTGSNSAATTSNSNKSSGSDSEICVFKSQAEEARRRLNFEE